MFVKVSITPSGVIEELSSNSLGNLHIGVPVTGLTTTPTGSATGDLSGFYPNPIVAALQGNPVTNSAPNINDVLVWSGTAWVPQAQQSTTDSTFLLSGFSSNNYYQGTTNTLSGSNNFTVAALVRQGIPITGGTRWIFACYQRFVNGGWAIGIDDDRPIVAWTSGSTLLQNFITTNADWDDMSLVSGKISVHMVTFDLGSTTISYYLNGQLVFSNNSTTFSPNINASPTIGVEWAAHDGAFDGGINGVAYTSTSVFTARQALEHYLACVNSGSMANSGPGFENLYILTSSNVSSVLEDQIGTLDFYLTGTLGVSSSMSDRLVWM